MKRETYICDECGAERKEANHWFLIRLNTSPDGSGKDLEMRTFRSGGNAAFGHYCGQKCVHAAIDRFMSTGKLEK